MVNSLFDITGKKAIVTGGTRGLGKGMAEGLMESGAEVAIIGTSDKVYQVADEFKAKGYGKIIMIASMCSWFGGKTVPAYSASKGGVMQLCKAFSNDLLQYGINVNAIAPGYMDTEMNVALTDPTNPKFTQQRYNELTQRIPAHRWGTPDDMKGCCIFLASHASDYLGGAIIPVDGGYLVM